MNNTNLLLSLSLKDVHFSNKFKLNQGAITQIINSLLYHVNTKLKERNNGFTMLLNPFFETIYSKIVAKYISLFMVKFDNQKKYDVYKFNLHGYNGKLNRPIGITGIDFDKTYENSDFYHIIKTLYQRIEFLFKRRTPDRYLEQEYGEHYEDLKTKLKEFLLFLKEVELEYHSHMDDFNKTMLGKKNNFNKRVIKK